MTAPDDRPQVEEGTVFSGSLKAEDAWPALIAELERLDPDAAARIRRLHPISIACLEGPGLYGADPIMIENANYLVWWTMFEALNHVAPEGLCFEAHPGDGADFGWWDEKLGED